MQLWHIVKIHPIITHNESKRQKDQRDAGKALHRLVHLIAHKTHQKVLQVAGAIEVGFGLVDKKAQMLLKIYKLIFELFAQCGGVVL